MKNFLYNKSDIIVALVIIVIAAFIVVGRVDAIMVGGAGDKPTSAGTSDTTPGDSDPANTQDNDPNQGEPSVEIPSSSDDTQPDDAQPGDTTPEDTTPPEQDPDLVDTPSTSSDITVTIEIGSSTQKIADALVSAGAISSAAEFITAVQNAGVETSLKAGTFNIPAGSTIEDIVRIVSN